MLSLRSLVAAGVVAATIAVAIAHAQSGTIERTAIVRAPAFSGRELTALPTTAWLTNGGDLFNRRYSPLTEITRDNVATLQGVWRTRLNGSGLGARYSGEAQPLVHEGVAYVITGANDVFAISLESGAILWTYRGAPRSLPEHRVLRVDEPRCRTGEWQGVCRSARWQPRRAGPADRYGRVVGRRRTMAGRLHDHERAAVLRRADHYRICGRRVRSPRPCEGIRRQRRPSRLDVLYDSRSG